MSVADDLNEQIYTFAKLGVTPSCVRCTSEQLQRLRSLSPFPDAQRTTKFKGFDIVVEDTHG